MDRKLKQKKCRLKSCDETFTPRSSTQVICSMECAIAWGREKKAKKHRAETRGMKLAFNAKDRSHQLKLTRAACHKYILKRDEKDGCIACGIRTGKREASHYYTVGHAPELRFHPDNIHSGCSQCNNYKSGNIPEYTIGLEKKIGRAGIDNLARCRTPQNLTLEDIKDIREWYDHLYTELISGGIEGRLR